MVMMTIIDSLKKQLSSSFWPFLSGAQWLKITCNHLAYTKMGETNKVFDITVGTGYFLVHVLLIINK